MMTRRARWATSGVAAAILLAAGFWAGRSLPTATAAPDVQTGTVTGVAGDASQFDARVTGTSGATGFALGNDVQWRDKYGLWHVGGRPACMKPLSHGEHITFGVVNIQPSGDAMGVQLLVWLECARVPIPRYPIVRPQSSGPA